MTHRIINVKILKDFVVLAFFQNGVEKEYDIQCLFEEFPQFAQLKEDTNFFKSVKVDVGGYGISWNDEFDLSAEEIWDNGVERKTTQKIDIGHQVGYKLTDARNKVNIRIELYSFEDIYELASNRNDVFFRLLKNEFGFSEEE